VNKTITLNTSGKLLHNLFLFGRLLRQLGLDISPGRMITLVQALEHIEIGRRADFYHATRCVLVQKHEDIPLFDRAFSLFWRRPSPQQIELELPAIKKPRRRDQIRNTVRPTDSQPKQLVKDGNEESGKAPEPVLELTQTYSRNEILRKKDFADLSYDEIEAIKDLMAQIIWQMGVRRTRRRRPGRGPTLDFRRSFRRNLRYGGEILEWSRRKRKIRYRPLVIIADISGSMERYSRLVLHFVYGLTKSLEQPVETFVFSTRLTRITRQLRDRDVDRAMHEVSLTVPDWSGGTRIGEAIKQFNYDWNRRVLGRGAVVLLISDGWDRGDVGLLGREMDRLQRCCHRLIWLNPLLGSSDYEPLTRGMQASLPYIDDFLPVHNLASLEDLARRLTLLDRHRPVRSQKKPIPVTNGF
jgi:uncharacterized protein with von Willebrand factor type A (vWA) domain